jgi:maleate cis-trans isomerase
LERDLRKPVISSVAAMMWHCLKIAGVEPLVPGYGRLLGGN